MYAKCCATVVIGRMLARGNAPEGREHMSFGFIEVITLLLGMAGFGVQQNPKAPTADQALQYALPDADVVVHVDAAAVLPGNYKVLKALPDQAQIKASPELAKAVRRAIGEIEGARGLARTATGIDLVSDISDATVFFRFVPEQDPQFVAAVHGKFTPVTLDKIGKVSGGAVTKVGGGAMVDAGGNDPSIGLTKDGVLIVGTSSLVRDRVGDGWKAPTRAPGSGLAHAADAINARPLFAVVLTMSPAARTEVQRNINRRGGKNFLTDVVQRHKLLSLSVFHDGVGWSWIDSTRAGLDAMELSSEGLLELMKAAHIAPRGIAKIALGALDSYKGTDKRIDDLIRRKKDLMTILETYTGDGNFATKIDKDTKALRLTVRATGKSLSEVLPAGFVVPVIAGGMLMTRAGEPSMTRAGEPTPTPVMVEEPAPRPASPGLGGPRGKKN